VQVGVPGTPESYTIDLTLAVPTTGLDAGETEPG